MAVLVNCILVSLLVVQGFVADFDSDYGSESEPQPTEDYRRPPKPDFHGQELREAQICTQWNGRSNPVESLTIVCPRVRIDGRSTRTVIYVSVAFYGKSEGSSVMCDHVGSDSCTKDARQDPQVVACQTETKCKIEGDPEFLPGCDDLSDYLVLEYYCIPETNMYDVCDPNLIGNMRQASQDQSSKGFLLTPSYPEPHPQNLYCQCTLTTSDKAKLAIRVLDFHLENGDLGLCQWDYLEFLSNGEGPGMGKRICGARPPDQTIILDSSVQLIFHSDENIQVRGFWLEYWAQTRDGHLVPVQADCGDLDEPGSGDSMYSTNPSSPLPTLNTWTTLIQSTSSTHRPGPTEGQTSPTSMDMNGESSQQKDGSNAGVIGGVVGGIAVCILAVVAVVAVICMRKRNSRASAGEKPPRPPAQLPSTTGDYTSLQPGQVSRDNNPSSNYTKIFKDSRAETGADPPDMENIYEVITGDPVYNNSSNAQYTNPTYDREIRGQGKQSLAEMLTKKVPPPLPRSRVENSTQANGEYIVPI